jgi:uncharacterized membrane protein
MFNSETWRSGYAISVLFMIFLVLICITPPLQSPDEFDHIKRAYALSEGTIFFKAQGDQSSGAMIDDGLIKYIALHDSLGLNPDQKVASSDLTKAKELRWEGTKTFSATPATAFYFPLIYAPQASALYLSKMLCLSINQSYYLTRIVASVTVLLILAAAFTLTAPSPVTLALLTMPMSIFQLPATSLDGIATALAILFISIFLKILREPLVSTTRLFWLALFTFALLASSRLQLLPFFLFFLILFWRDRNYAHLTFAFATLGLVCAWVLIAGKYTVDHRVPSSISSSQVAIIYLRDPIALAQVLWSTLTDDLTLRGYFTSFLGMLGWLTATFPGKTYIYLLVGLLLISGLSLSLKHIKHNLPTIFLFSLIASLSIFLIMFAMLTTWTPYPSTTIIGVQGRYFLIPAILLSYGFFPAISALSARRFLLVFILLTSFTLYSLYITIDLLLMRYYISDIWPTNTLLG